MGINGGDSYKGVPFSELRIDEIAWSEHRADHIRTRSQRRPGEVDLEPEWATEAALDEDRLVRLGAQPADPSTQSLKVVGMSKSCPPGGVVLQVWIWSDTPEESGIWQGGSAAIADRRSRQEYEERKRNERS